MSIEETVLNKLKKLPAEQKQEVLNFVDFIHNKYMVKQPRKSLKGLWSDLNINIDDKDIVEARKEMWGNFPKEFNK